MIDPLEAKLVADALKEWTNLSDYELDVSIRVLFDIVDSFDLFHYFIKNIKYLLIPLITDVLRLLTGSLQHELKVLQVLLLETVKLLQHSLLGVVFRHVGLL